MEFVKSVFLHSGFLVGQNWSISVVNYSINHRNTKLNAETKIQSLNRHILEFWVVLVESKTIK